VRAKYTGAPSRAIRFHPFASQASYNQSTLTLLPLALVGDRPWLRPLPGAKTWAAVIGLALLCTALAYVIYFRILATSGASNLLLVTLLMPASAILLGTTVLGERLAPRQLAGMALIAAGLAAVDGRAALLLRRLMVRRAGPASLAADKTER